MKESGENYLETILLLKKSLGRVRAIDVAMRLNYSKPSVSRAIGILKKSGYIEVEDDGAIELTEFGAAAAIKIYERHTILTAFLCSLGVSEKTAAEDACRIEHVISAETFEHIKKRP